MFSEQRCCLWPQERCACNTGDSALQKVHPLPLQWLSQGCPSNVARWGFENFGFISCPLLLKISKLVTWNNNYLLYLIRVNWVVHHVSVWSLVGGLVAGRRLWQGLFICQPGISLILPGDWLWLCFHASGSSCVFLPDAAHAYLLLPYWSKIITWPNLQSVWIQGGVKNWTFNAIYLKQSNLVSQRFREVVTNTRVADI